MSDTTSSQPAQTVPCEAACGQRVGDRRVRVQRQPRSMGQKMSALVRRVLANKN